MGEMQGGIDNLKWNEERRGILSSQRLSDKGTILQPNCRSKLRYFHQLGLFQPPKNALAPKKNGQTFSRSRKNRTFALLNSVLTALRIGIEYEIIKRKQQ